MNYPDAADINVTQSVADVTAPGVTLDFYMPFYPLPFMMHVGTHASYQNTPFPKCLPTKIKFRIASAPMWFTNSNVNAATHHIFEALVRNLKPEYPNI